MDLSVQSLGFGRSEIAVIYIIWYARLNLPVREISYARRLEVP